MVFNMKYTLSLITISILSLIALITFNSTSIATHYQFKPINKFDQVHLSILSTESEKELDLIAETATEDHHQWALKNSSILVHQKSPWTIESPKVNIDLNQKKLLLHGSVHATQWSPPCNKLIMTRDLTIDIQQQLAQTSNQVHVQQGSSNITGKGLTIELGKNKVVLNRIEQSFLDLNHSCIKSKGSL